MITKKKICMGMLVSFLLWPFSSFAHERLLKVGVTGDYQPMTWYDKKTQRYVGFDIDMAKYIAQHLHAKLVFVKTTWKTLEQDLLNEKFDIAISGVSITPEREKKFVFSNVVLTDKKVVVLRCADEKKLNSWNSINQPTVRLIENQGGTNEAFAEKNAKKAHLILCKNNRLIFNQIINNKADAMITDSLEANYQIHQNTALCILNLPKTISPISNKAYMLRKKETILLNNINLILQEMKSNKSLNNIAKKWHINKGKES